MVSRTQFNLVTINTWKGDGPYRRRVEVLADQLRALDADAIACQESLHTEDGALSTGEALAAELGMQLCYTPSRRKPRDIEGVRRESWSGLALLTRWPISDAEVLELPADPEDGERLAQLVTLDTPAGPVLVANTHLTHLRGRDDLRTEQLRVILEAVSARTDARLRLLCGDLNARPGSPPIEFLESQQPHWVASDAWALAGSVDGWATLSDRNAFVRNGVGDHTIDYIWEIARSDREAPAAIEARVVLDQPDADGTFPSDHFGVMGTFELG